MPDKPLWLNSLPAAIGALEAQSFPWVSTNTIEGLLGVSHRHAQRILAPLVKETIGRSGLAIREDVIARLRLLATGDLAWYDKKRREKFRAFLDEAKSKPRVLVEAPQEIVNQQIGSLPEGVSVAKGKIMVEFGSSTEALEKLLALAMAIGNDPFSFEQIVG